MINRLPRSGPVHVIDRFLVGGPASMRGFRSRGVGEHDGRDPLGAEFYATAFMGLALPIGFSGLLRSVSAKAHAWGMVGDVNSLESLTQKVGWLFKKSSAIRWISEPSLNCLLKSFRGLFCQFPRAGLEAEVVV